MCNCDVSQTIEAPLAKEVVRPRWRWIERTIRKPAGDIAEQVLGLEPTGSGRPGRLSNTYRRTIEKNITDRGKTSGAGS